MLNTGLVYNGPSAIRYPRGNTNGNEIAITDDIIEIGKSLTIREGNKIALLVFGELIKNVIEIAEQLSLTLIDMRFAKPIDTKLIQNLNKTHDIFITIEENAIGGFSSQVNDFLINKLNKTPKILNFFMKDEFIDQSDIDDQYNKSGISKELIFDKVSMLLK